MHEASHAGYMCMCVHAVFVEGIDLGVIHRKVLKVQSLLWCSLYALPKDNTLMFHFPMSCLGIKAKRERGRGVLKRMLPIRIPIQEERSFTLMDLRR